MFGLFCLMPFGDNKGRKKAICLAWLFVSIGIGIMLILDNVYTVFIGLFLSGFGATAVLNLE